VTLEYWGEACPGLLSFEVAGAGSAGPQAALANLLASEENRKAVVTTLVADVAVVQLYKAPGGGWQA